VAAKKNIVASIGICADLHQDIIYDAPRRLQAFIDEMNELKPDFIIQLEDFCTPKIENKIIMDIWDQFTGLNTMLLVTMIPTVALRMMM